MNLIKDIQSDLNRLDTSIASTRRFGKLMFFIFLFFLVLGCYLSNIILIIVGAVGSLLILIGLIVRQIGNITYRYWMAIALLLGWIMSRVLLIAIFYLIVTPIGLLTRIFHKKFLDIQFKDKKQSYWIKKDIMNVDYTKMS